VRKLVGALGADGVFDPETIHILVGAFDAAWEAVQTSGAPVASERYIEFVRQILAKNIIENAKHGERNQHLLTQSALLILAKTNLKDLS
jgi:hypothetical protein